MLRWCWEHAWFSVLPKVLSGGCPKTVMYTGEHFSYSVSLNFWRTRGQLCLLMNKAGGRMILFGPDKYINVNNGKKGNTLKSSRVLRKDNLLWPFSIRGKIINRKPFLVELIKILWFLSTSLPNVTKHYFDCIF